MQEDYNNTEGITFVDLFNMLLRNIFLIIAITVAITIIGVIYTFRFVEPRYASDADVWVQIDTSANENGGNPTDYDFNTTLRIVQSVAELFEKDVITNKTIEDLNLSETNREFSKNLKVSYNSNSFFINISYEYEDPVVAGNVVNKIIANTIEYANEHLPAISNTVVPIGQAEIGKYSSPNKPLNIIISVVLGGMVGVGAALLFEALKTTVRNKEELESFLPKYKVIGQIPIIYDKEN